MYTCLTKKGEGIANVFPKQMRDFSNTTFQSEMAVIMLQLQYNGQCDEHCSVVVAAAGERERETTGASHSVF
jgi:hypothetical protein